jgi:nitroreductase
MSILELLIKNRSYRLFDSTFHVSEEILLKLVDLTRYTPSASNLQPLKYFTSCETNLNNKIFKTLSWAGYLVDWPGPELEERPTGYIVILLDQKIKSQIDCDHGIVAQTILLGAAEMDLSGCIIASVKRDKLQEILNLPEHLKILLVIALGKGKEIIQIEPINQNGDIRYWRDEQQVHHVPKRALEDIIITQKCAK